MKLIVALFLLVLLAGCRPAVPGPGSSPTVSSASSALTASSAPTASSATEASSSVVSSLVQPSPASSASSRIGAYQEYRDGVLTDGQTKLLFFHASWCPHCIRGNQELTELYGSEDYAISTYKVDYDTSDALKQRYRVTYQHTFVLVDGQGNELQFVQGPTRAQLQGILEQASVES